MSENLLEAVEAVSVHELSDVAACPLILHPGLDQIYGVHGGGSGGASNRAEGKPVDRLEDGHSYASVLRLLDSLDLDKALSDLDRENLSAFD